MEWWTVPVIVLAGFGCGLINTLAGSGSLVTLPLLIFLGLPPTVANGTNRVAILMQNIVGVVRFQQNSLLDWERGRWLLIPGILGALLGASIAVEMNDRAMKLLIACVMLAMLVVMFLKPKRWLEGLPSTVSPKPRAMEYGIYFLMGVYGGLIQAGMGIFLLASLVLASGYHLVRANAVKLLFVLGYSPLALFIFFINDQVDWVFGLTLALGNMAGAWVGVREQVRRGAGFVRWVLIAVVLVSAIKLFWDLAHGG